MTGTPGKLSKKSLSLMENVESSATYVNSLKTDKDQINFKTQTPHADKNGYRCMYINACMGG
jgi:hypothetical protein